MSRNSRGELVSARPIKLGRVQVYLEPDGTPRQDDRYRAATDIHTGSESLVQQQFRDEVDINTIVKRFGLTGQAPSSGLEGVYGDFEGITDYASAVAAIEKARESFMVVPPEVREKFDNDPGKLLEFVSRAKKQAQVDTLELDVKDRRQPGPEARKRRRADKVDPGTGS